MRILILGNGFDLAHNLPTQYTDFLEYIIEQRKVEKNENVTICDLITENIWIDYFVRLYKINLLRGMNWIDFELEISHILQIFDEFDSNIYNKVAPLSELNQDKKMVMFYNLYAKRCNCSDGIKGIPKQTYTELIETLKFDMERMIKAFEIYLIERVEGIDITYLSPDIQEIDANRVLSFNYTHIYEKLYSNNKTKVHHIHGEVKKDFVSENNMVLGVDEYWDRQEAHRHTNYNIFKKFTQRILKETGFEYRNWIESESKKSYIQHIGTRNRSSWTDMGITDVYVFGHSLDVTDSDILIEFFMEECFNVHIFYKDKIKEAALIANVVKMIGEDEFIRQINSVPHKIEFIKQKDMSEMERH